MPSYRLPRARRCLVLSVLVAASLAQAGCGMFGRNKDDDAAQGSPEQLYGEASRSMRAGNYAGAIQSYEALESRYPFTDQAKQGQLDLLYSYYKNNMGESALDQAEQFIRENPTHPRVDYAYYIRGLVYFESGANWLERQFRVDIAKRPTHEARKSYQAFQMLVQQYPKSPYAEDARQRMIYLRNRLADYEVAVARFYLKRGAYVGAVNRASGVLESYDGAPAVDDALAIMASAYRNLGANDLATSAENVRKANVLPDAVGSPGARQDDDPWWRFWN